MSAVLDIAGLRKTYRSVFRPPTVALDGLDLTVDRGQIHGILGPNGSGKTTTLRILLGLASADSGRMEILGEPVPRRLSAVLPRVGAVVESPRFFDGFTGLHTLRLLAGTAGIPDTRVHEVLEQVGLRDRARQRIRGHSLGMRQRLAVAVALLRSPELLVLDEPTNGMDPGGIRAMRELMKSLAAAGVTVLVSSHLLSEVEQLCDTMTIVSRGRRVLTGRVDEVITDHTGDELRIRVAATTSPETAARALTEHGLTARVMPDHLLVTGAGDPARVSAVLAHQGIHLTELVPVAPDLETVFLRLTGTIPRSGYAPPCDDAMFPSPAARPVPVPTADLPTGPAPTAPSPRPDEEPRR